MSTTGDGLGGVRGSMRSPDDAEGIDAEFLGEGVDAGRGVREVCLHPSISRTSSWGAMRDRGWLMAGKRG